MNATGPGDLAASAVIGDEGRCRYLLGRRVSMFGAVGGRVCWIMLNPSTADGTTDDPTIRKCRGFSERLGFQTMTVVNLFAHRATDPNDLARVAAAGQSGYHDAVGADNDEFIAMAASYSNRIIVAWGAHVERWQWAQQRVEEVADIIRGAPTHCLGRSNGGSPRHPLMLPYETALEPWSVLTVVERDSKPANVAPPTAHHADRVAATQPTESASGVPGAVGNRRGGR